MPDAREIECAVIGNDDPAASVAGEIVPVAGVLRLRSEVHRRPFATRDPRGARRADAGQRSQRQAILAFQAIDGSGLARVDFLLSRTTGELFVNEINTLPGFTTISMYAKLWAASGVDYQSLVERLVALAIARHREKQQLRTSAF